LSPRPRSPSTSRTRGARPITSPRTATPWSTSPGRWSPSLPSSRPRPRSNGRPKKRRGPGKHPRPVPFFFARSALVRLQVPEDVAHADYADQYLAIVHDEEAVDVQGQQLLDHAGGRQVGADRKNH